MNRIDLTPYMPDWDRQAFLWINSHHNRLLDAILYLVSLLGERAAIWILVALLFLIFGKAETRRIGMTLFSPCSYWMC